MAGWLTGFAALGPWRQTAADLLFSICLPPPPPRAVRAPNLPPQPTPCFDFASQ